METKQEIATKEKEEVYPDPNSRDEKTWLVNQQPERRKFRCEDKRLSSCCISLIPCSRMYTLFEASFSLFAIVSDTVYNLVHLSLHCAQRENAESYQSKG